MRILFQLIIISLIPFSHLHAQIGFVNIEVKTTINKFTCSCTEQSFVCKEIDKDEKILKLPVESFNCPKKLIERDLAELFESEKHPFINVNIISFQKEHTTYKAQAEIVIKEHVELYDFQLEQILVKGNAYYKGSQEICLTNYNIEPPVKALGLIKVDPTVKIEFKIPEEYVIQ